MNEWKLYGLFISTCKLYMNDENLNEFNISFF